MSIMILIFILFQNPDRRLKTNDYQFVYVSHEQNGVVGRSKIFKISDIAELDSQSEGVYLIICLVTVYV